MARSLEYRPSPQIQALGARFFDPVAPADFPRHTVRFRNDRWAHRVGLGDLSADQWVDHFGRFEALPANLQSPLALRYHGHQFRSYNPELGDGRGFLYAQLLDGEDDRLLDLATKGSGQTPWSRAGDGRLTLKGGVREVLATELLEALGVYTSKSFSLIETGEELVRGDEPSPTRSSVLVRLGHSHIRFGSFQRQAYLKDDDALSALVDYCVAQYSPSLGNLDGEEKVAAWFSGVVRATADLAASWHLAGFVHGVLNTDNMNVTGESFDYGPYRFLPTFDLGFVAAYFDHSALYAFGRQPGTLGWNLARLAETLTTICPVALLQKGLEGYEQALHESLVRRLNERLNIRPKDETASEAELLEAVFGFLQKSECAFERFFFDWYGGSVSHARAARSPQADKYTGDAFDVLSKVLDGYDVAHPGRIGHAYFQGAAPCTLLIEEIETIWSAIADRDDWSLFEAKLGEMSLMREALQDGAIV